jgi:hypothetical protein
MVKPMPARASQLEDPRREPLVDALALQQGVTRLERRELDRDAGARVHCCALLTGEHLDRVRVGIEVALRVGLGAGAFAEHIEGAQRESGLGAGTLEGRVDCLADDERLPEQVHRLPQRRAHDRRDHWLGEGRRGDLPTELRRHLGQQPAGRAQQRKAGSQQQVGITRHAGGTHGGEALGDQLVGTLGVGRAQQRLRQTHERLALGAVERELLEHPLDQRA